MIWLLKICNITKLRQGSSKKSWVVRSMYYVRYEMARFIKQVCISRTYSTVKNIDRPTRVSRKVSQRPKIP